MRKRDLSILMLSAFAIFFSLHHEGDFSFREAWFHLLDDESDFPIRFDADRLPPPLVTDLNADGKSEVLLPTRDAKIQVLEPHSRRVDEGFSEARVIAEVSLLPDKIRVASGRRPVAMATGVIDRSYRATVPLKQVLVVVTADWTVMCFDHNLKKLWEENLQNDFPHNVHHREIAISVSNYTIKHGDTGLVIIGGRMEPQPHSLIDPFEELGAANNNTDLQRRSASEKEDSDNSGTMDLRHFAFYAFAGKSGVLRWSRKNENIEAKSKDAQELMPQHSYKLDANSLNSRHPGEFECRDFRESVIGVMPHHWDRREDTLLKLTHFRRHKRKTSKKTPGADKSGNYYNSHKPDENHSPGKDDTKRVSNFISSAANLAASKKVRKSAPYVPTITNYTQLWWVPNVVVAHEEEGIEAVHLATGRTICKRMNWLDVDVFSDVELNSNYYVRDVALFQNLASSLSLHLQEGGLHADINGDGVLDHVQAVGGAEQTVVSGSMDVLRPCWAIATSGVPVREQLFNVSICRHSPFNILHYGDLSRNFQRASESRFVEVATPILIRRNDGNKYRMGSHGDVIFLTNRGEVTSYRPGIHGDDTIWQWQISTGATWSNLPLSSRIADSGTIVATLKAFSLRAHDNQEMILVAGDQEAAVISPSGSILATIDLPSSPTHALITEDFSNDGLIDIILVTSHGVYGFVQTRQPGALFFSTLVGCLIVVMGVIFVTQHLNSMKGKPRPPSTR